MVIHGLAPIYGGITMISDFMKIPQGEFYVRFDQFIEGLSVQDFEKLCKLMKEKSYVKTGRPIENILEINN